MGCIVFICAVSVPELSLLHWAFALLSSFIIGMSKSGIKGFGIVVVALMAIVFGGKASTGIILPLLITGDIFAVFYYHRHAEWKYLIRLLPWMMIGVILGTIAGKDLNEEVFKQGMAIVIFISVIIMIWWDLRKSKVIPKHWSFAGIMGLSAGFTTMVGNLAGSFSNLFFLAMRLPKDNFIGTTAWLFLFINLFKVPFHVFSWETITLKTLTINLYLIPAVIAGMLIGVRFVKKINEKLFRRFILVVTAISAIIIYFK